MLFTDEQPQLDHTEIATYPASNNPTPTTITVALMPEWQPTDTQGYTYHATWTLPDGSSHHISHRTPEREVCRVITHQGHGHARVTFIDGKTMLPRLSFRRADIASRFRLEERSRDGLQRIDSQIPPQDARA